MDHFSPSLFAILNAMENAGEKRSSPVDINEELLLRWRDASDLDRAKWLDRANRFLRATRSPEMDLFWEKTRAGKNKS